MNTPLVAILTRQALHQWAGEHSFERGEEYFSCGQVRGLAEDAGAVTAKVRGNRDYRVKLWVEEGEIAFSCTCPVGAEGAFCKHGVAVGLVSGPLESSINGETESGANRQQDG